MCGIAGILRSDGASPDVSELSRLAALAHRGPDDEGLNRDGPVGLVHRRLSILDLSAAGHQPMANEDGTVWVVYNGQLFDFEPLRERLLSRGHRFRPRTDTEILEIVERIVPTHLARRRDHSRKLLTLAVLEMRLAERERAPAAPTASEPVTVAGV